MTHRTGIEDTDLAVDARDPSVVGQEPAWRPGSTQSGLDDRVEFAELGDRIAVRDPDRPAAPALLFDRTAWESFCARTATIDLRDHPSAT